MKNKYPQVFKMITRDEMPIRNGQSSVSFFGESDETSFRITDVTEQHIINWIINDLTVRRFLLSEILMGSVSDKYLVLTGIKDPLLNSSDQKLIGDIDFIATPISNPEYTTVVEFKRIKIRTDKNGVINKNKLNKVKTKGTKQIRELSKFKFHRLFLGIIIQDDGQFRNEKGTMFREVPLSELYEIFDIRYNPKLHECAGVFYFIINQPQGKDFTKRHNLKIAIHKPPTPTFQNTETTKRIKQLILEKPVKNTIITN